jgi:hypothetical protein
VEKEDMARNAQSHPRQLLQSLLAAVLLFNTAQRARASVTYQYVAGQGTYTTTQGNIIGVPIYLQETLTSGSTSLITAGNGLFCGGFAITLQSGSTAGIGSLSGATASFPGGYFVLDSTTAGSTSSQRGDNIAGNLTGPGGEPNVNGLVLLGTAYIQASSVAAGVATFSVGAYSPGNGGYTQTFTAPTAPYYYDLDLNNNGTASGPPVYNAAGSSSFEVVTIVPEPTSIQCLAGGLAASLGCGCRARRGRPPRCVERISALR